MTTDGYVEHIVKTKTSAGIMALIVLGAIITMVGAFLCSLYREAQSLDFRLRLLV